MWPKSTNSASTTSNKTTNSSRYHRAAWVSATLTIPYEYTGIDHAYEPDFLVRLQNGVTLVLEIKGFEDDQTKAKHNAAKRWVEAVNNWGQLGTWAFHVCRNPQLLDKEMDYLAAALPGR